MSRAPRILVIRRDNIGDLACTTPLLEALRAAQPHAWIGVLATTYNAEVLARNPSLDEVLAYEKAKHRRSGLLGFLHQRLRLRARLRRERLDWVVVPAPAPQTLALARRLGARGVIAADASPPPGRHEVERCFELGSSLGVRGKPGPLRVYPDPRRVAEVAGRFAAGPVVAIHVSARRPLQRWPLERYAELARELARDSQVMLLWAPGPADDPRHPGDDAAAARLAAAVPRAAPVATPDLATLVAALAHASLVVCPDGGAMHLAAALGKPVVALFGDSPVERWRPWGVPQRVLRPDSRDLADLELAPVLRACRELARPGPAEHAGQ